MNNSPLHTPEILRLLAHPLRWQLVKALCTSDRRVQELVEEVQQPYNLVSYHLKLLRASDLVALRKSDADGRDLYYSLNLKKLQEDYQQAALALHPGWTWKEAPPEQERQTPLRVLFLCTHNSARSQMAEGLLRHLGGERFVVASAGSQPHSVHPDAVAVMSEMGIDIRKQQSKHLAEFQGQEFDVAVTVCDRVREECPTYNFCESAIHWSIPDPAAIADAGERRRVFDSTVRELQDRVQRFMKAVLTAPSRTRSSVEAVPERE